MMADRSLRKGGGVDRRSLLSFGLAAAVPLPACPDTDDWRAGPLFAAFDQAVIEHTEAARLHDAVTDAVTRGSPRKGWNKLSPAAQARWLSIEEKRAARLGWREVEDRMIAADRALADAETAVFQAVFRDPRNVARKVAAIDRCRSDISDAALYDAAIDGLVGCLAAVHGDLNREGWA